MSIRKIIDWSIAQADGDLNGTIASPFYQYAGDGDNWMWACDVDIGQDNVLTNVPVAINNRDIIYAQEGKSVALKRMNGNKYVIVGLSKMCRGLGHVTYVTFADDRASITRSDWTGKVIRPLTLGELAEIGGLGFGSLPLGTRGRFTASGSLIDLLEG